MSAFEAATVETQMKRIAAVVVTLLILPTYSFALRCSCDDWMEQGGYCVDYVKERIPAFPIPSKDDMEQLPNADVADVEEGDVAIFSMNNYWHVAYVEKVHRDAEGKATALDVSEMNFGGQMSFAEFKARWKSSSKEEWHRASCCGITDNYDRVTRRKYVAIETVTQLWSPDEVASERSPRRRLKAIAAKAREVMDRFYQLADQVL